MTRLGQRRASANSARDQTARDLPARVAAEDVAELDRVRDRARARAERNVEADASGHRLSQANRGLRMILIAAVSVVVISWGASLGGQYLKLMQIETLVAADQDVLKVMCAVEPPNERALGWMHICETAAGVGKDKK